jgi:hypothetical protein
MATWNVNAAVVQWPNYRGCSNYGTHGSHLDGRGHRMDNHRRLAVPRLASLLARQGVASSNVGIFGGFAVVLRLAMIGLLGACIRAFLSVVVLLRLSHALSGGQPRA